MNESLLKKINTQNKRVRLHIVNIYKLQYMLSYVRLQYMLSYLTLKLKYMLFVYTDYLQAKMTARPTQFQKNYT